MKVLFCTIALSLFSLLQARDLLSSEQFGGIYFVKAIVTDCEFLEKNNPKYMSPLTITPLSDGDLEVKFTTDYNGRCEEIKKQLERTNQPGIYSTDAGNSQVLIEETSVRDYWILFYVGNLYGMQIRIVKLVGPYVEENPQAFQDFKKFASLKGFNELKIKTLRQAARDRKSPAGDYPSGGKLKPGVQAEQQPEFEDPVTT
ncbi:late lactation protein B-like [Petaurus breviceps papuanus]|uniref:late lactation protein B-like n=1 Tax=Petaurus breviceps papuanus TaxID=3040969 RepID=UPI0036DDAABD